MVAGPGLRGLRQPTDGPFAYVRDDGFGGDERLGTTAANFYLALSTSCCCCWFFFFPIENIYCFRERTLKLAPSPSKRTTRRWVSQLLCGPGPVSHRRPPGLRE